MGFSLLPGSKTIRTFDPKKVLIIYGILPLTGFAPDTFLNIKRTGDVFKEVRGTDCSYDRIHTGNIGFDVTFTLSQQSPSNAFLSGILHADMYGNIGGLPLVIRDLSGYSTYIDTIAYIVGDPSSDFSRSSSTREWRLRGVNSVNFVGFNS